MSFNESNVNTNASSSNNANLLKRVSMFLEEKNWDKAYEYCERILDMDSECAEAYFFKLMADMKASKREELSNAVSVFENNINYTRVMQFGSEELKQELENYNLAIKARNENNRKDAAYRNALEVLNAAKGIAAFSEAVRLFTQISDWRDSSEKIAYCEAKIEELKQQEAAANAERERAAEEARKEQEQKRIEKEQRLAEKEQKKAEFSKKYKKPIILASILVLIAVVAVLSVTVFIPMIKYNKAVKLLEDGEYEEAYALFEELGDYKDSEERMLEVLFEEAMSYLEDGDYDKAYELFDTLEGNDKAAEYSDDIKFRYDKVTNTYADGRTDVFEYEYGKNGEITKEVCKTSNGSVYTTAYEYDTTNNLKKSVCTDSAGGSFAFEYEYDSNGKIIKETYIGINGKETVTDYIYDANGNMAQKEYAEPNGDVYKTLNEYNPNGVLLKTINYAPSGNTDTIIEYKYDSNGFVTDEVYTSATGDVSSFKYEYDGKGNVLKETYTNAGGKVSVTEYDYDSKGNMIKKVITEASGDVSTYEFAYDTHRNKVSDVWVTPHGEGNCTYTYTGEHIFYDAH